MVETNDLERLEQRKLEVLAELDELTKLVAELKRRCDASEEQCKAARPVLDQIVAELEGMVGEAVADHSETKPE